MSARALQSAGERGAAAERPLRYRLIAGDRAPGTVDAAVTLGQGLGVAQKDEQNQAAIRADHAVMQAIAGGSESAFARLAAAESPRLLRFATATLSDIAEAEEVVQEALLRLWRMAADWQPQARVATFLHQVAYRLCIDRLRKRRPHVDIDALDDVLEDGGPLPDRHLLRNEDVRIVRAALDRLPDRQRVAIVLSHFQELAQEEAAAVMGIGEHAYESLLARGRRRLRTLIGQEGEISGKEGIGS